MVLSSITKKGEIKSASRPLNLFLVILDNHNLGYDAFNEMCAGINKNNQEEGERKAPNSNSLYGGFYRIFNFIFRFEIEYRTTVLSRRMRLIDLGR